jgi:hypothetical protein
LILYGWRISDLLVLGIIACGGIYYVASTGMLNNILPPPPPPQQQQCVNQLPTEASLEKKMI